MEIPLEKQADTLQRLEYFLPRSLPCNDLHWPTIKSYLITRPEEAEKLLDSLDYALRELDTIMEENEEAADDREETTADGKETIPLAGIEPPARDSHESEYEEDWERENRNFF